LEPVVFRDVDAARAAFAMGQVIYRCLLCGRTHRSGGRAGRNCIKQLAEQYGWKAPRPPVPPVPREIGLAYRFALRAYSSVWNEACRDPWRELLPEYVLALDPRCDLRSALNRVVEDVMEEAHAAVERAWEAYRTLWVWLDALAEQRPPCDLFWTGQDIRDGVVEGMKVLWRLVVRPGVPCPFPGAGGAIDVPYWDYVPGHELLVYADYGLAGFGAVSVSALKRERGQLRVGELIARIHRYDSCQVAEKRLKVENSQLATTADDLTEWVSCETRGRSYRDFLARIIPQRAGSS
jgi:hypothetical protein